MIKVIKNIKKAIIMKIEEHNDFLKTFHLKEEGKLNVVNNAQPGNYIMLWIWKTNSEKNRDFIPMSISDCKNDLFSITVKRVGPTTKELYNYQENGKIGFIGPLGNHFKINGKKLLLIGGGTGIAPLHYLAKEAKKKKCNIFTIIGAISKDKLIFVDEMKKISNNIIITTDDGTFGKKGYASDMIDKVCNSNNIDQIFACGPEEMMKKILDFSIRNKIPSQFSLERYMHCGLGYCGLCSFDDKWVCIDGPVFDEKSLHNCNEFGENYRSASTQRKKYRTI